MEKRLLIAPGEVVGLTMVCRCGARFMVRTTGQVRTPSKCGQCGREWALSGPDGNRIEEFALRLAHLRQMDPKETGYELLLDVLDPD